VSPKNLFFLSPPQAAREKKAVGDTPNPGREDPAPLKFAPIELASSSWGGKDLDKISYLFFL